MGHRLALGGELYYHEYLFLSDDYDQSEYGGTIFLRKPLGQDAYVRTEYRLQNVKIDADNDASPALQAEDGKYLQSMIGISGVHDTRDNLLLPRNGHKISLGGDYSGIGGDVNTYGFELAGSQHFDLPFDTILNLIGAFNTVDDHGSDGVPIFEREFLGGPSNLRGFDYWEVGPKDINGQPLGGRSSWFGTVEYSFPLINSIRGSLFYDVGAVSLDSWDTGGPVNSDWGIGLRIMLLGAPVQFTYGFPIQSDELNDSSGQFHFSGGYRF